MSLLEHNNCVRTLSGKRVNLINPKPDEITIEDIARGLAFKSHFGGHTPRYFSVAEHSLLTQRLLPPELKSNPIISALALLHDAPEAYLGDCVKPLKDLLPNFVQIEKHLQAVIMQRFNLPGANLAVIKPYDIKAQEMEYVCFYSGENCGFDFYSPEEAMNVFLHTVKQFLPQ